MGGKARRARSSVSERIFSPPAEGWDVGVVSLMEQGPGQGQYHLEDLRAGRACFVVQLGTSAPYEVRFGGPPGRMTERHSMRVPCAGAMYTVHGPALTDHKHNYYTEV